MGKILNIVEGHIHMTSPQWCCFTAVGSDFTTISDKFIIQSEIYKILTCVKAVKKEFW